MYIMKKNLRHLAGPNGVIGDGPGWGKGPLSPPSSVPPLVMPHLFPVAEGGKVWSIRPSPPPSYTACAVAYGKENSR